MYCTACGGGLPLPAVPFCPRCGQSLAPGVAGGAVTAVPPTAWQGGVSAGPAVGTLGSRHAPVRGHRPPILLAVVLGLIGAWIAHADLRRTDPGASTVRYWVVGAISQWLYALVALYFVARFVFHVLEASTQAS